MLPVLFSVGSISISSFGVFLFFGFLVALFLVWRLSRAWDLDEEKVLDLTILTILSGLIGARIYFVVENWQFFADSPLKFVLINKYPGFSFWGALPAGWLMLSFLTKRYKMNFWQVADIASVGILAGVILADLGCFLGGCGVGVVSKSFLAVSIVGQVGKRWPVQLIEALILSLVLLRIWAQATHFHQRGKIVASTFIYIGLTRLLLDPLRSSKLYFFDITAIILGIIIFYRVTGRNIIKDIKSTLLFLRDLFIKPQVRRSLFQNLSKSWYNQKTSIVWKLKNIKKALKKFNVKFSWKNPSSP